MIIIFQYLHLSSHHLKMELCHHFKFIHKNYFFLLFIIYYIYHHYLIDIQYTKNVFIWLFRYVKAIHKLNCFLSNNFPMNINQDKQKKQHFFLNLLMNELTIFMLHLLNLINLLINFIQHDAL